MTKKNYTVGIPQVHMCWVTVLASSLTEARQLAMMGKGEMIELEYQWDLEEEIQVKGESSNE